MPTPVNTIPIAEISQYLCAADILGAGLDGGGIDLNLPQKIYMVRKNLSWLYDLDPTDSTLQKTANYLYGLCGEYALTAQNITGGGSAVAPTNPAAQFPIYITSADFSSATAYNNSSLLGNNIVIYVNELNQYVFLGTGFEFTATGINMLVPGFDATTYDYNLVIEKVS